MGPFSFLRQSRYTYLRCSLQITSQNVGRFRSFEGSRSRYYQNVGRHHPSWSDNSDVQMEQYIFKRRQDGVNIINLKKTWEKLMLAARAIAAIENPSDVFVVSSRPYGQRAVLK